MNFTVENSEPRGNGSKNKQFLLRLSPSSNANLSNDLRPCFWELLTKWKPFSDLFPFWKGFTDCEFDDLKRVSAEKPNGGRPDRRLHLGWRHLQNGSLGQNRHQRHELLLHAFARDPFQVTIASLLHPIMTSFSARTEFFSTFWKMSGGYI